MNDWKLGRRHGLCARCRKTFAEGEHHFSSLIVSRTEIAREDQCETCWRTGERAESLFWWRARHSLGKRAGVQLNLEALERLFLHLEGREELELRELRYVLCLILLRKRRLKVRQIQRDAEGESFLVARPRRPETLRVYVFDFTPERIDELRARLQQIFDGAEPESDLGAEPESGPASETDGTSSELETERA